MGIYNEYLFFFLDDLIALNKKFIEATKTYDRLMAESLKKYDGEYYIYTHTLFSFKFMFVINSIISMLLKLNNLAFSIYQPNSSPTSI
jgi:hypothetical protein